MKRPCIEPGCNQTGAGPRCPTHTYHHNNRAHKAPHHGAARTLRRTINQLGSATCNHCHQWLPAPQIEVDHITPLANGGTDNPHNVQTLCIACHHTKTSQENQQRNTGAQHHTP